MLPTKKGVTLTNDMWKKLLSLKDDIDATIDNMSRGLPAPQRPQTEEEPGMEQNEEEDFGGPGKMSSTPQRRMGEEEMNGEDEDYGGEL